jgi:hypothetical protein
MTDGLGRHRERDREIGRAAKLTLLITPKIIPEVDLAITDRGKRRGMGLRPAESPPTEY